MSCYGSNWTRATERWLGSTFPKDSVFLDSHVSDPIDPNLLMQLRRVHNLPIPLRRTSTDKATLAAIVFEGCRKRTFPALHYTCDLPTGRLAPIAVLQKQMANQFAILSEGGEMSIWQINKT